MPRKGKDFELLIKKLENIPLPVGAIIKSPDYIEDEVTGSKREIDISIKYTDNDCTYMTIIECRDRCSTEDVTWIEQLITKARDMGADKIIAVSSAGFSQNAIKKASHYRIELKTYRKILQEDVDWFTSSHIMVYDRKHIILCSVINLGDIEPLNPPPFENKKLSEILLIKIEDNKKINLSEVLHENISIQGIFDQLPQKEGNHILKLCIPKQKYKEGYGIESNGCFHMVQHIEMLVEFCIISRKVPVSRRTIYSSQLGSSMQIIEFSSALPGQYSTLQLIKAYDGSIYSSSSDPTPH